METEVCEGYPDLEPDYQNALLSQGNVDLPRQVSATSQAERILLKWNFNSGKNGMIHSLE